MKKTIKLLNPAPTWTKNRSGFITLWHGCTANDAAKIKTGISLTAGSIYTDFGQGFYVTTLERQARQWAWNRYYGLPPAQQTGGPVILRFRVSRAALGKLQSLHFVLGDYNSEDYWSLVQHCRNGKTHHPDHPDPKKIFWYEMVSGPVAAFWQQRVAMVDADQVSFHTAAGINLLDTLIKSGNPTDFKEIKVTGKGS